MPPDDRAHDGHRLTPEKLSKKLDTCRRTGAKMLYLHERDLDDAVVEQVFGDPALPPLPAVTLLQLQGNPRLTSKGLSVIARAAPAALSALEEIYVSYTSVTDLSPLAAVRTLKTIHAQVERPQNVAPLAALPKLKWVSLSGAVPPDDVKALKQKKGRRVELSPWSGMPSRFTPKS